MSPILSLFHLLRSTLSLLNFKTMIDVGLVAVTLLFQESLTMESRSGYEYRIFSNWNGLLTHLACLGCCIYSTLRGMWLEVILVRKKQIVNEKKVFHNTFIKHLSSRSKLGLALQFDHVNLPFERWILITSNSFSSLLNAMLEEVELDQPCLSFRHRVMLKSPSIIQGVWTNFLRSDSLLNKHFWFHLLDGPYMLVIVHSWLMLQSNFLGQVEMLKLLMWKGVPVKWKLF